MYAMPGGTPKLETTCAANTMRVLSEVEAPLEVGDVELDREGHVRARVGDLPMRFSFVYRRINFTAELPADREAPLTLNAVVGILPFSSENAFGRRVAHRMLTAARLPRGRFLLDVHSRVHVYLSAIPPRPRTPVSVVATAVALLMDIKPHLDLFEVALRRPRRPLLQR